MPRSATTPATGRAMTSASNSRLYSLLLFLVVLSAQQMYKATLASTELYTLLGGFVSSLLFFLALTFIGNVQESMGSRTGWGSVVVAELIACIAAGTVHRVCVTTCFIFSLPLLYEVNRASTKMHSAAEHATPPPSGKKKAH